MEREETYHYFELDDAAYQLEFMPPKKELDGVYLHDDDRVDEESKQENEARDPRSTECKMCGKKMCIGCLVPYQTQEDMTIKEYCDRLADNKLLEEYYEGGQEL